MVTEPHLLPHAGSDHHAATGASKPAGSPFNGAEAAEEIEGGAETEGGDVSRSVRVLVVDDQALVREGFQALLHAQEGITVVGSAGDGAAAVQAARRLALEGRRPDVVVMDVRMPVRSGIEATADIAADPLLAAMRVLVLTTYDIDDYVYAALRAGASGFLLKDAPAAELVRAVRVVARGEALLAPELTQRLIAHYVATHDTSPQHEHLPRLLRELTAKEVQVLVLVARGASNKELAGELFIAEQTAKSHVSRIFTKLGLRDRAQAVAFAYESGLVMPGRA